MMEPTKRILVVDDDRNLRTLLRITLEGEGVQIVEAGDGFEALEIILAEHLDGIVLDWRMPGLDGHEVLRRLAGEPRCASIPVVVVSACPIEDAGVDDLPRKPACWITKPFSPVDLLDHVRAIVGLERPLAAAAMPTHPDPSGRATMTTEQLHLYVSDLRAALERERDRVAELEEARRNLQRLDGLKSTFLDFISHELRTPLQQMSVIDLLDEDDGAGDLRLRQILHAGYDRLCHFVDEGLRYIDAAARTAPLEALDAVAVVPVLQEAAAAAAAPVSIRPVAAGIACRAEPTALREAVRRVVAWAAAETPAGSPLTVDVVGDASTVVVEVASGGGPDNDDEIRALFEPFPASATGMRDDETGLDLAIARELLRRQGGTLIGRPGDSGAGVVLVLTMPAGSPGEDPEAEHP